MNEKLGKTEITRQLRLGNGHLFQVTEATITAEALKRELGSALSYTDAIDLGDIIVLPITPYIYANADEELSIANRVMLGDSLSHLSLAPSQRIHAYWIENIEHAMCAQVYFDYLLPAQISDTRDQLALIKRENDLDLKRLNIVCGQHLTDRALDKIVSGNFKHSLSKATPDKVETYRKTTRGTKKVSHSRSQAEKASEHKDTPIVTLGDSSKTIADSETLKEQSTDRPSDRDLLDQFLDINYVSPKPLNIEASPAQANWIKLGLEPTFNLTLPKLLKELSDTHTPEQIAQAEALIQVYPVSHNSDPVAAALLLLDELNAQCGINTDTIKRRLTARGNT